MIKVHADLFHSAAANGDLILINKLYALMLVNALYHVYFVRVEFRLLWLVATP